MTIDRSGLEVLEREECLRLLAPGGIGRVGLTSGALPVILPVTYAVDRDDIVLRAAAGTLMDRACAGQVVAFETDDFDPAGGSGWSVLVTGRAEPVEERREIDRLRLLALPAWSEQDDRFVRISTEIVSGRRTLPPERAAVRSA